MEILTKDLILKPLCKEDEDGFFNNLCHDNKVSLTFVCPYIEKREDFKIDNYLKSIPEFAIHLRNSSEFIGIIFITDYLDDALEIGYAIGSKYWNNGYTTQALKAYISYLFQKGCKKIVASHFENNPASGKVMEKAGMRYLSTSKKSYLYQGVNHDLVYYVIEKSIL